MAQVTHETGLVTIPQPAAWPPIQAIRAEHDRKLRRRMSHITPIDPSLPAGEFEAAATRLVPACAAPEASSA